ncbi:MAG: LEA type 2 family protein [Leptospira sp.]|nr:LEA type 2 family protein [Leptospira sp.]
MFLKKRQNLILGLTIFSLVTFSHCVSDAKKNIDRLKKCKITLSDVELNLVKNPNFPLFPKLEIFPIVTIKNPNPESVQVYEFDLGVTLILPDSEEYLGKVKNGSPILVQAESETDVKLSLELDESKNSPAKLLQLGLRTIAASESGKDTEIQINGSVLLDSVLGKIPVPVSEKTKIRIKK